MISLGTYPDPPLSLARERLHTARQVVAQGIDPSAKRRAERLANADNLQALSQEFFELHTSRLEASTLERDRQAVPD